MKHPKRMDLRVRISGSCQRAAGRREGGAADVIHQMIHGEHPAGEIWTRQFADHLVRSKPDKIQAAFGFARSGGAICNAPDAAAFAVTTWMRKRHFVVAD